MLKEMHCPISIFFWLWVLEPRIDELVRDRAKYQTKYIRSWILVLASLRERSLILAESFHFSVSHCFKSMHWFVSLFRKTLWSLHYVRGLDDRAWLLRPALLQPTKGRLHWLVRLYKKWKVPVIWSASSLVSFSRKRTSALRSSFHF